MNDLLGYIQIGTNIFALSIIGWIYQAYIKNLKQSVLIAEDKSKLAKEQIALVEKHLSFLKGKIEQLEKNTPDHLVLVLNQRIKIFEEEIGRLNLDREAHASELTTKNGELATLKSELSLANEIREKISKVKDEVLADGFLSIDLSEYEFGIYRRPIESFSCVQELLDDLYITCLHHEHPTYTYLKTWKLFEMESGKIISSKGKDDRRKLFDAGIRSGVKYKVSPTPTKLSGENTKSGTAA